MSPENLRIVTALGVLLILILLRLQAEQFGAAEYDEPGNRYGRGIWTRLSWYALGFGLLLLIYAIHPRPHDVLFLLVGKPQDLLVFGLGLALVGAAQAALLARYRYGELRLPPTAAYPGAVLNSVATGVIDEATFRGVLQGTILAAGLPWGAAVAIQALVYVLTTRLAAPGHSGYMLALASAMGLAFGWATYLTGGIGAAILAHAITSFALFVCTGHAGSIARPGEEPEEVAELHRPSGWLDARRNGRMSGSGH
jgi:membrane protease YdiL (CAAX protease family)